MSHSTKELLLALILWILCILIILILPLWLRPLISAVVSAVAIGWWIIPYIIKLIIGEADPETGEEKTSQ